MSHVPDQHCGTTAGVTGVAPLGRRARERKERRVPNAVLAAHLTARDRWLLRMLAEHRVLTTHHLVKLAFPSPRAAQLRLAALANLGVITAFRPLTTTGTAPAHWVLDTPGRTVLEAEDGLAQHNIHPRGRVAAIAHSQQLTHLLGVNTCLSTLAANTLTTTSSGGQPESGLTLWWGQARGTRHFGDHARPDAYAVLTHHGTATHPPPAPSTPERAESAMFGQQRELAFFLEYDTGTEALHRLADKLPGYHQLAAVTAITTPLLFWLPGATREAHARHVLAHALAAVPDPHRLPVATASSRGVDDTDWHPHRPVWAPLHPSTAPPGYAEEPPARRRHSLLELAHLWAPIHPSITHNINPDRPTNPDHTAHPAADEAPPFGPLRLEHTAAAAHEEPASPRLRPRRAGNYELTAPSPLPPRALRDIGNSRS
jgi:Replication-relaxation